MNSPEIRTPRVHMTGVGKTFGTTTVLSDVELRVMPGEVVGVVGQNGAGKSTLMKILGGVHPDHAGTVRVDGREVRLANPREALHAGIGMIHQELSLVPSMSVAENILLGREPGRLSYRRSDVTRAAAELIDAVAMMREVPLDAQAGQLSAGLQQRVEIAKALSRDARVLVMDEPTARLSGPERRELLALMRELAHDGLGIIYISHFLDEVFDVCDRLTVLRNGRVVAEGLTSGFTMQSLTSAMLGAELAADEATPHHQPDQPRPEALLHAAGLHTGPRLKGINLTVGRGEIVGLAGLVGSGRTRLLRALAGADRLTGGRIELRGRPLTLRSPRDGLAAGIVMIPEDRKSDGIVASRSAAANVQLMALEGALSRGGFVRRRTARARVDQLLEELQVSPRAPELAGALFSGGNQQKLLMARALLASPHILLADQPTAGVDVGTKVHIHDILRRTAADGIGVVVASDDVEELLAMADRILVMRAGRVHTELPAGISREALVAAISGDDLQQAS